MSKSLNNSKSTPKNRITMKIIGGIGNQLFGLVFGLAVADKLRATLLIDESLIPFGSNKSRTLGIRNFKVSGIPSKFKVNYVQKNRYVYNNAVLRRIIWKISVFKINSEKVTNYLDFKFKSNQKFFGYFQTWFYIDLLKKLGYSLSLSDDDTSDSYKKLLNQVDFTNDVVVHVRLGDFLKFPAIYPKIPEIYYAQSLEAIRKVKSKESYIVVTEDRRESLEHYPKIYLNAKMIIDRSSGLSDFESFLVMSKANYLVSSNSTFSMWAAWMVKDKDGLVIVPDKYLFPLESQELVDTRWDKVDKKTGLIYPGDFNFNDFLEREAKFNAKF